MVITLLLCFSFAGECSFSTSTRLSSYLVKKYSKFRKMVEHFKEIGIVHIIIVPKSIYSTIFSVDS